MNYKNVQYTISENNGRFMATVLHNGKVDYEAFSASFEGACKQARKFINQFRVAQ
jgi:hypothetical protein